MEKKVEGIYDGFKELGTGKMLILGFQHVFAMFGATVRLIRLQTAAIRNCCRMQRSALSAPA